MRDSIIDVLLVTDLPFWRRGKGSFNRIDELHRELKRHFNVWVYVPEMQRSGPYSKCRWHRDWALPDNTIDAFGPISAFSIRRLVHHFFQIFWLRLIGVERDNIISPFEKKLFISTVSLYRPKVVVFEFLKLSPLAEQLKLHPNLSDILRVLDTHDVQSKRSSDFEAVGVHVANKLTMAEETRLLDVFDILLGITEDDSVELRSMCPRAITITAAHPVVVHAATPVEDNRDDHTSVVRLIASGTPSQKSLTTFLDEVWPLVQERSSGRIILEIVGGNAKNISCRGDDNIRFLDRTDTIEDLFLPPDIIVNPMICGSGLKIKNLEALSFGKPLVTTTPGAQGMPERETQKAFVVADTADDLANAIVQIAESTAKRDEMSREAQQYILTHFTRDVVYGKLVNLLRASINV